MTLEEEIIKEWSSVEWMIRSLHGAIRTVKLDMQNELDRLQEMTDGHLRELDQIVSGLRHSRDRMQELMNHFVANSDTGKDEG